jgi:hypothetical protein
MRVATKTNNATGSALFESLFGSWLQFGSISVLSSDRPQKNSKKIYLNIYHIAVTFSSETSVRNLDGPSQVFRLDHRLYD